MGAVSTGMVAGAALQLGGPRRRTALESAGLEAGDLRRRPRLPDFFGIASLLMRTYLLVRWPTLFQVLTGR